MHLREEVLIEGDASKKEETLIEDDVPNKEETLKKNDTPEIEDIFIEESIEIVPEEEMLINQSEVPSYNSTIMPMNESEEDDKDIGAGLTFTINKGTLTISGNGQMCDWKDGYYADVKAPWRNEDVTNVRNGSRRCVTTGVSQYKENYCHSDE